MIYIILVTIFVTMSVVSVFMAIALKAMGGDVDWDKIEKENFDQDKFHKWNKENAND